MVAVITGDEKQVKLLSTVKRKRECEEQVNGEHWTEQEKGPGGGFQRE